MQPNCIRSGCPAATPPPLFASSTRARKWKSTTKPCTVFAFAQGPPEIRRSGIRFSVTGPNPIHVPLTSVDMLRPTSAYDGLDGHFCRAHRLHELSFQREESQRIPSILGTTGTT